MSHIRSSDNKLIHRTGSTPFRAFWEDLESGGQVEVSKKLEGWLLANGPKKPRRDGNQAGQEEEVDEELELKPKRVRLIILNYFL